MYYMFIKAKGVNRKGGKDGDIGANHGTAGLKFNDGILTYRELVNILLLAQGTWNKFKGFTFFIDADYSGNHLKNLLSM